MNSHPIPRRTFLKLSGAAGLALAGAGCLAPTVATAGRPFERSGSARLLLSLAAYSFRDYFEYDREGRRPIEDGVRQIDLFDFVDYCAEHGCQGAELTRYYFPPDVDEAYLIRLRRHAFLRGVAISGTAVGNNFTYRRGRERDAQIAYVKRWIDHAAVMGTSHVRVFTGNIHDLPEAEAYRNAAAAFEECGEYAGRKGIFLGIENHDSIGDAGTLLGMVRAVNHPWVGVNLDTGNFRTGNPYRDFEECLPYAVNIQLKLEMHRRTGQPDPADLPRLVKLMRDAGYQGYVALEYESGGNPWKDVPPALERLRELFARA